ncbi:hypothetical protein MYX76_12735 [Desulfobacterota bacterium AH_259_B03_O07]|nr:hypothetical protein [Desulfobacterota bacterium AH_259_B03_O07]
MKPLPRSESCEKNLLGCCIENPDLIDKHNITPNLFYEERDKIIFNTIVEMKSKNLPIGDLEIRQYLIKKGKIKRVNSLCPSDSAFVYMGNLAYLAIQGNTKNEVARLKQVQLKRELWKKAHRLIQSIERESNIYAR